MDTIALDNRLSPQARKFVGQRNRLLIDGKLVDAASSKTFPVYNPATGTILAQVAEADAVDVDLAVKAARRAFDDGPWNKMSPSDRGKLLRKLADLVEKHSEELAEIESIDNGKPVAVARMADVPLAVDMFRYMASWAAKITGSTIPL
jgi:phenylacetaldehyde dehydrogenase